MSPTDKLEFLETFAFKDIDLGKIKARCKAHIQNLNDELSETIGELNISREFIKEMSIPEKIEFPIKCGKNQYEKAEKNEVIRYKNVLTMIKRHTDDKNKKERELNDLKVLEATIDSRIEHIETIDVKIKDLEYKKNKVFYGGYENLKKLENNLISLISQRELLVMEKQYKEDSMKLEKMRIQESVDFDEELSNINNILWKEHSKDDIEEQKSEIIDTISDLEKAKRLYKDIDDNNVDEDKLKVMKDKIEKYSLSLDEKRELHRKLLSQKEIYKCPSCFVSLSLIENSLRLSAQQLDEDVNDCSIEVLLKEINGIKKDIVNFQKYVLEKENKLVILKKCKCEIEDVLSNYEEAPSSEELIDEITSMKEELTMLNEYQRVQLEKEKRKKEIEYNIKNEIFSKSYLSFKSSIEKLHNKIEAYKCKIEGDVIYTDEEELRFEITKEKQSRDMIKDIEEEENILINDLQ
jgi:hypothetical protein